VQQKNDRYRAKSKSGGRKGHQVSQSGGFKQIKHVVNKSLDSNAGGSFVFHNSNTNDTRGSNP